MTRHSLPRTAAVGAFLVGLAAGCGGSSGPSFTPPGSCVASQFVRGPGDTANLFPIAAGSSWTYVETSASAAAETHWTVTASETVVDGQPATIFTETSVEAPSQPPRTETYRKDGGGLLRVDATAGPVTLPPYTVILFPIDTTTGYATLTCTNVVYDQDLDGDGLPERLTLGLAEYESPTESVTVPAGTFDATPVGNSLDATITGSKQGSQSHGRSVLQMWFAPGVGLVKSVRIGTTTVTRTLVSYRIGP